MTIGVLNKRSILTWLPPFGIFFSGIFYLYHLGSNLASVEDLYGYMSPLKMDCADVKIQKPHFATSGPQATT